MNKTDRPHPLPLWVCTLVRHADAINKTTYLENKTTYLEGAMVRVGDRNRAGQRELGAPDLEGPREGCGFK